MSLSLAYFGTYEPAFARNAVMLAGLREAGVELHEFNAPLAHELAAAEMATVAGAGVVAADIVRAHYALLRQHRHALQVDVVVVGYPGHLLVPFGRLLATYRRALLVFDPLVSLTDTFAGDRGLVGRTSSLGLALTAADKVAFGLPDLVLADTAAQAAFYRDELGVAEAKLAVVPVGAQTVAGAGGDARRLAGAEPLRVLMYGKWSPLQGAETVVAAAEALRNEPFHFVFVGEGQLSAQLRATIAQRQLTNVEWLGMLSSEELRAQNLAADVCLGVFGGSSKAARVVPNKVVDGLACGRPVVTQDSPAARELLSDGENALLVPALDVAAVADALRRLRDAALRQRLGTAALRLYRRHLTPAAVADSLLAALERLA
ncbi:MAG: glycosyltransferase family 4 protein [Thermoleophilia bacterium]